MTSRRAFLKGTLAAVGAPLVAAADEKKAKRNPSAFWAGAPCLQAPAATSIGISWAVSGLAKGEVEVADNPDFKSSRIVRPGGLGLVPIDAEALQVRLEGLKASTRYWYRTITTPFLSYSNIYEAKLGEPIVSAVHSFSTMGVNAPAHFCVINDTHAQFETFARVTECVTKLKPSALIWNGDATNSTQDKATATEIFLNPPIERPDYAADIPTFFVNGNHDFRGSWISRKEEVVLSRPPSERPGDDYDLKWNFAERLGDVALIGLDTGEDKPDAHPKWFGLANFSPYRRAQAVWLEKVLKRPDIAQAKFKVVFCHIPLYLPEDHPGAIQDGTQINMKDFANWSRECRDLWAPILARYGVKAVIAAHLHEAFAYPATPTRPWCEFIGGGPKFPTEKSAPGYVPTVIEGCVEKGVLTLKTHDIAHGRVIHELSIS